MMEFWILLSIKKNSILKKLVASNSISEETRRSLKLVGTRPGIMYGLCKALKDFIDKCLPFWPILSAVNTPTYKLAKFLISILKFLTSNECAVKDSFAFADEVVEKDAWRDYWHLY